MHITEFTDQNQLISSLFISTFEMTIYRTNPNQNHRTKSSASTIQAINYVNTVTRCLAHLTFLEPLLQHIFLSPLDQWSGLSLAKSPAHKFYVRITNGLTFHITKIIVAVLLYIRRLSTTTKNEQPRNRAQVTSTNHKGLKIWRVLSEVVYFWW